jgi:hypothetical protein
VHIPLAISWPGHIPPRLIDSLVELIDIAPTLMEAGLQVWPSIQGKSLWPLLTSTGTTTGTADVYCEYYNAHAWHRELHLPYGTILTKAIDPTRPVISNDGWEHTVSDILGIHDYALRGEHLVERYHTTHGVDRVRIGHGPQRRRLLLNPADQRGQPVMLTEFGGVSYQPKSGELWHGYATVENQEEYFDLLHQLFDAIHDSPELAGYCYTQLTDTLQERNGLLTETRKPKLPVEQLREIISRPSKAILTEHLDLVRQKALKVSGILPGDE